MIASDRNHWKTLIDGLDPLLLYVFTYCQRHAGDDFSVEEGAHIMAVRSGAEPGAFGWCLDQLCHMGFVRTHRMRSGETHLDVARCPREVENWSAPSAVSK